MKNNIIEIANFQYVTKIKIFIFKNQKAFEKKKDD